MKKLISRVLCAIMLVAILFTFAACGVSGTYVLKKVSYGGISMDADSVGFDAEEFYIELSANGKAVFCYNGEEADMEWKDGEIWPVDEEDSKADFEIEDGELTIEIEDVEMIFVKEK